MPKVDPIPYTPTATDPAQAEEESVHEVYEAIAPHFAKTRYKPWPIVSQFLQSLPPHSLGLDSGAGNGKYLPTGSSSGHTMLALDRSSGLLEIARHGAEYECIRADLGFKGWREGVLDCTISIAAIHHLSTPERRRRAVQALFRPLGLKRERPYSRFLVYVWAYEQGGGSKRRMGVAASTSGHASEPRQVEGEGGVEGKVQDVLVPWVLQSQKSRQTASVTSSLTNPIVTEAGNPDEPKVYHRYYHLFVEGELRDLIREAAGEEGYTFIPNEHPGKDIGEGEEWARSRGEGWEADNWWFEGEVGIGPPDDTNTEIQ